MPRSFRILAALLALGAAPLVAQTLNPRLFAELHWRMIGPPRSGQISAVAGVAGDPAVYYVGTPGGGVWKTTDAGTVWEPISAGIPVQSIGFIAPAPSNPQVVYVGTGNTMMGDGMYKSADGGATWRHIGLEDTRYITAILVDPANPEVVLAGAGSGGNFGSMVYGYNGATEARGIYRSSDGGAHWQHTLAVPGMSVEDMVYDLATPQTVFASLVPAGGGGGRGRGGAGGAGPQIYKSSDGGATWAEVQAQGLPGGQGAANIAVAMGTHDERLYALAGGRGGGGLFRSDDGGAHWTLGTSELASASGHVYVDPKNPDVVYTMGTSTYRSTDGGHTLAAYKGSPGGDDDRIFWIDPTNPERMIIGADQGPTISVDGGKTWTPWFNLPNGEHYYVATDNQFPYRVYAAQQDSGTSAVLSRGDYGSVRPSDWYPVGGYEEGHILPDPSNPRFVYTHADAHNVVRYDKETGQTAPLYMPAAEDRFGPRPAMALMPKNPHGLLLGAQYVLESDDNGTTWRKISPDLTVAAGAPPAEASGRGSGRGGRGGGGGTLVAIAPSPVDANVIWAGSSNGLIQLTRDGGKSWSNVSTPTLSGNPELTLWSIEASSHEAGVAYAAAIDIAAEPTPFLIRTTDFGKSWQPIVSGLDPHIATRVVREDLSDPSLLYAGTQAGMWVSFDRGDHWQSLQLNLPVAAVNDITLHENDLVVATFGRALWILDDVTPLQQIAAAAKAAAPFLYQPETAIRSRWDESHDTPLPPEVPQGENPPDGAILDYYLPGAASGPVTLSILDSAGKLAREYSSTPAPPDEAMTNVPLYWFKAPEVLATSAGMHRLAWDIRYPSPPPPLTIDGQPPKTESYGIEAPAIKGETPRRQPIGVLAPPGVYTVKLSAGGREVTRTLTVRNDPRSPASAADLLAQAELEKQLMAGMQATHQAELALIALHGGEGASSAFAALGAANRGLSSHLTQLDYGDIRPGEAVVAAAREECGRADAALEQARPLAAGKIPAGPACGK